MVQVFNFQLTLVMASKCGKNGWQKKAAKSEKGCSALFKEWFRKSYALRDV